jgi:hypothetical protein
MPARSGADRLGRVQKGLAAWEPLLSDAWDAGANYRLDAQVGADFTDPVIVGVGQEHAAGRIGRYAHGKVQRLAITSLALGMSMGLDHTSLVALYRGAFLHDIGNSDSILLKRRKLTPDEWTVMRGHPVSGAEICSHLQSLGPVVAIIRAIIKGDGMAVAIRMTCAKRRSPCWLASCKLPIFSTR